MRHSIEIFDNLAEGAAAWLLDRALRSTGPFSVCLSGGSTPKAMFDVMATPAYLERFPWSRTSWFWGDERFVPADDPASNYGMALHAFLSRVPAPALQIHPILTERMSPREAAEAYEAVLKTFYGSANLAPEKPLFDVAFLGIGDDGHTASLIPGQPVLAETTRWVAEVPAGREEPRITLTYPALNASACVAFLAGGVGKKQILAEIRGGASDKPAARIKPVGELVFLTDHAAAG